jgi:hypothetical protein
MLTVCAMVGSMLRVIRVNADRDTLRLKWKSDGLGVLELMDVLNKGVGGAGTTKRTPANEYKGSADMAEFAGKFKLDQRVFAVAAGDAYTQLYLNALQCFASQKYVSARHTESWSTRTMTLLLASCYSGAFLSMNCLRFCSSSTLLSAARYVLFWKPRTRTRCFRRRGSNIRNMNWSLFAPFDW